MDCVLLKLCHTELCHTEAAWKTASLVLQYQCRYLLELHTSRTQALASQHLHIMTDVRSTRDSYAMSDGMAPGAAVGVWESRPQGKLKSRVRTQA